MFPLERRLVEKLAQAGNSGLLVASTRLLPGAMGNLSGFRHAGKFYVGQKPDLQTDGQAHAESDGLLRLSALHPDRGKFFAFICYGRAGPRGSWGGQPRARISRDGGAPPGKGAPKKKNVSQSPGICSDEQEFWGI